MAISLLKLFCTQCKEAKLAKIKATSSSKWVSGSSKVSKIMTAGLIPLKKKKVITQVFHHNKSFSISSIFTKSFAICPTLTRFYCKMFRRLHKLSPVSLPELLKNILNFTLICDRLHPRTPNKMLQPISTKIAHDHAQLNWRNSVH